MFKRLNQFSLVFLSLLTKLCYAISESEVPWFHSEML